MTTLSIQQRTELGRQAQLVIDARKRFRANDFGPPAYDVATSAASKVSWDRRQAALIDYRKAREDFLFARIALALGDAEANQARKVPSTPTRTSPAPRTSSPRAASAC
jgi:hypothetical protein